MDPGNKKCVRCGIPKPIKNGFYRCRSSKDGHHSICKECSKKAASKWKKDNADRRRATSREWERRNASYRSLRRKQQSYGITPDDYKRMFQAQSGKCAVCSNPMKTVHVDHDHLTGKIRDLLCPPCNRGLGFFRDDPVILKSALNYLIKHGKKVISGRT